MWHTKGAAKAYWLEIPEVKRKVYQIGEFVLRKKWMIEHSFSTGNADTFEDLLKELEKQVAQLRALPNSAEV